MFPLAFFRGSGCVRSGLWTEGSGLWALGLSYAISEGSAPVGAPRGYARGWVRGWSKGVGMGSACEGVGTGVGRRVGRGVVGIPYHISYVYR